MKRTTISLCLILIWFSASGQTFQFSDSTFVIGSKLTRGHIYNPNCHIDQKYLPFLDSLVNFLLNNSNIKINIEFYGDGYDDDDFEIDHQKTCGQHKLIYLFTHHYPKLNQDRIGYVIHGNADPLHTKEEILRMKDRSEQIKANQRNRRTVITISSIVHD